jgi:hypothetical protein
MGIVGNIEEGIREFVLYRVVTIYLAGGTVDGLTGTDFILAWHVGQGTETGAVAPDAKHVLLCGADEAARAPSIPTSSSQVP